MVSFQCEGCGDVLTKKKLDGHRSQCHNASFSCLDCMTHFRGSEYKSHTSCMTEDQKYQGALYKERTKKSVKIAEPNGHTARNAYVEDAPDPETGNALSIVSALPEAPIPPPAAPSKSEVNVFDYLVTDETPNASKISLVPGNDKALDYTPSIVDSEISKRKKKVTEPDPEYEKNGFSYGTAPLPSTQRKEKTKVEYITPGNKDLRRELEASYNKTSSVDKKRKRHVEDLDLTAARASSHDSDALMEDALPVGLHTGLTGGLNRLLSKSRHSPSDDYPPEPPSPVKRSRSTKDASKERSKSRAVSSTAGALVRTSSHRRTSDEGSRPRKKKKHRTHSSSTQPTEDGSHHRRKHRQKAIEYPQPSSAEDSQGRELVVYKSRAQFFMTLIEEEGGSSRGTSVHKILKRYHRERGREKEDEEKELFKGLRVRRNEKGEVVVFF